MRKLFLEGQFVPGEDVPAELHSPFDGRTVAQVAQASAAQVDRALAFAEAARRRLAAQSTGKRRDVLTRIAEGLRARSEEFAESICSEAGKPLAATRVEIRRAIETFQFAAAELSRFGGSIVPVDFDANSEGLEAEVRRFPAGTVVGIVPFNFPLNLGAHKVAPALAVGAPIVVKPPPQAPSAQLLLAELALAAGADPAALQVLPCRNEVAERLAIDARVRVLSFTGSARVGWRLKQKAAGKVALELGGNAAALVCDDAELDWAAARCALSGFTFAGQVCIKVQRVLAMSSIYDAFVERLLDQTDSLVIGDPADERTVVGPVIDLAAAERIERWIEQAVAGGARVLRGGKRTGRMFEPTVIADAPADSKVRCEEVFGPVVLVDRVDSFEEGLEAVNRSAYGLQAALFTRELARVRRGFHALEVGGVIVNDAPSFRSDNMPYGGVKQSGLGREGVSLTMEEYTEERVLVTRLR